MTRAALALVLAILVTLSACVQFGRRPPRERPTPARPDVAAGDSLNRPAIDSVALPRPIVPLDSANRAATPAKRAAAEKPAERCILDLENTADTRFQSIKDPISGRSTTYLGGGVLGHCRSQNITIIADSAETYEQNQLYYLLGNVKYREKRVSLDADKLSYFRAEERLLAEGNVRTVMQDSSTMTGSRAEYFRAVRGLRVLPRIVATNRPTLRMYDKDSLGKRRADPVTLVADNIVGEGESLFTAWGRVELDRTDLSARGDSANLDNTRQFSRLMKAPFIASKGKDPFTLKGRVIDLFGRTRAVERVYATDSAIAVNKDLTLASDTIDLRVNENKLQRAYAFGPKGASAISSERTILADSLDVFLPAQTIRELHAIGHAYAESDPDSLKIRSEERDWLRGDTIVARFDSIPAKDTTSKPKIRELVSTGNASSYYQVPSNQQEIDRPGINYVRGGQIRVDFGDQEVKTVTVFDEASGVYLEAKSDTAAVTTKKTPARRAPTRGTTRPPARPRTAIRRP